MNRRHRVPCTALVILTLGLATAQAEEQQLSEGTAQVANGSKERAEVQFQEAESHRESTVDNAKVSTESAAVAAGRLPGALRTGFSLATGAAFLICVPDGKAYFTNTFPGMSLTTSMEVRFWYLGLAVDFDYGWFITEGDGVTSYAMHATPVLKGYYPLESMEIYLGFGSGYGTLGVTESKTSQKHPGVALHEREIYGRHLARP